MNVPASNSGSLVLSIVALCLSVCLPVLVHLCLLFVASVALLESWFIVVYERIGDVRGIVTIIRGRWAGHSVWAHRIVSLLR